MQPLLDIQATLSFLPTLVKFLPVTLLIFCCASVIACVVGAAVALIRVYRLKVLNLLAIALVSYSRGTPVLVQLLVSYYILPQFLTEMGFDVSDISAIYFVVIAYGFSMGAHLSEILRSAILNLDKGQAEAAMSIGMTSWQAMYRIIAPQAIRTALPDCSNIFMFGLKSTSLAFTVGIMDMAGRAQALGAQTMQNVEVYAALAIIYYVLYIVLNWLFRKAENRLNHAA